MIVSLVSSILALSRLALVSGYSYRDGYRDDRAMDREGRYKTFGYLQDNRYSVDSRGRYDDSYGDDECPYENQERTYKKKRSVQDEPESLKQEETKNKFDLTRSLLVRRLRRHDDRYYYNDDRYRDERYNGRTYYDDRFRDERYYDREYYDDRYREDKYKRDRYDSRNDYRGRSGVDRCGRRLCDWEAELECNIPGYRRGDRVRWDRENDAYYPRDKYRDLDDYFGSRAVIEDGYDGYRSRSSDGAPKLIIKKVHPEDKGVYRCYLEGGYETDFAEIHFNPIYPLDDNDSCEN